MQTILRRQSVADVRRIDSGLRSGHHRSYSESHPRSRGLRDRLRSCGFVAAVLLSAASVATADPSSAAANDDLQQQIVKGLAAGHDVKSLIQQVRASAGATHVPAPIPPRSEDAAQLAQELNNFHTALVGATSGSLGPDAIRRLAVQYQQLLADHLLFVTHLDGINATLSQANASSTVQGRAQAAHDTYAQTMAQLTNALDPTLGAVLSSTSQDALLSDTQFQSRVTTSLTKARAVLEANASRTPSPVLRASTLPFRQAQLAQRQPTLSPTIQPSYLNPSDAAAQPTQADLAATDEVQLTDEILQQASSLNYDYIRIYEFVRNQIRTEWYAGSMKGAVGTLRQGSGNDVDQASLLIALFRASGLPCRYEHGVIELPIQDVMSSLGLTDPNQAATALTRAGVAYNLVVRGGGVAAVDVEHTWVTAQVPYTNYRGAMVDASGATWVPLAPALKQYNVTPATEIFASTGLSASTQITSYLSQPQQLDPLSLIRQQITNALQTQGSTASYQAQLGSSSINPVTLGLLPNTLPVSVVAVTEEAAALSDAHRQLVEFIVRQGAGSTDPAIIDYKVSLATVASERITLSYIPATVDDQATVDGFGGLDYTPVYLVKLRPQIKIDGQAKSVATDSVDAGVPLAFEIHLIAPFGTDGVNETVTSGGYQAVGLYAQKVARVIPASNPADTEYTAASLLDNIVTTYSDSWNQSETELSGLLDVAVVHPWPTVAVVGNALKVDTVLGRVMQLGWQGVSLDATLRISEPVARGTTPANAAQQWMQLSALQGSVLEHQVFETQFAVNSISADKGFELAQQSTNNPVLTLTTANIVSVLPTLNLAPEVITDIQNWVRLGLSVDVPQNPITYEAWTGSVWRAQDPTTGAAGYFISGGLAGGQTAEEPIDWLLTAIRDALMSPNTTDPDTDPLAAGSITSSNGQAQQGVVNTVLPQPLSVVVKDLFGKPVSGASVTFNPTSGEGSLIYQATQIVNGQPTLVQLTAPSGQPVILTTDHLGVVSVQLQLGKVTASTPTYIQLNPQDVNLTRVGQNVVDVSVQTHAGALLLTNPFQSYGTPDKPATLVRTNSCCVGAADPGGPDNLVTDLVSVMSFDQYLNPISNQNILFTLISSADGSNGTLLGVCGGTCIGSVITVPTGVRGASANVSLGTAATYTLTVVGGNGNYTTNYTLATNYGFTFTVPFLQDELGDNLFAAKVATRAAFPFTFGFFNLDKATKTYSPWPVDTVQPIVDNGGSMSTPVGDGAGHFTSDTLIAGPTPGLNDVSVTFVMHNPNYPGVPDSPPYPHPSTVPINSFFGLSPTVTSVAIGGTTATAIPINEDGLTEGVVTLNYTINPAVYIGYTVDFDYLQAGQVVGHSIGWRTGTGRYTTIPRDLVFTLSSETDAQLVINRGTLVEVRSDLFKLPLQQTIFKSYDHTLYVSQQVDALNQRACTQGQAFSFSITQAASITLTAIDVDNSAARTVVFSSQHFDAGDQQVDLLPSDLTPGVYAFELTAVSDLDGSTQTVLGKATSQYVVTNALPVGHMIVKGVDLKYGNLTLGTTDFTLPGRGAQLEFRRSYVSSAPYQAGPLGARWTHNYNSKIITNTCGDVIVVGGDGSGMTFVSDGKAGFTPLKGYHGTLVYNADGTYDFYSKDGTRYHYHRFDPRKEWDLEFIQDTNANVTKLGYDPSSPTVAKLITVQDSAGRALTFTYENRTFVTQSEPAPVITEIDDGSDGIKVTFTYDDQNNLIGAAREAIRTESYAYSPSTSTPISSQVLKAYTNPDGATTQFAYNAAQTTISPQGGVNITAPNLYVTDVTDSTGAVTHFAYDTSQWLRTVVTDANSNQTTYAMNAYGSPLSITDPAGTTTMVWSPTDVNMTSKTDARGVQTKYSYDGDGNALTETVDGLSNSYTYLHMTAAPFIKNRVLTKTDRNGKTTSYNYDGSGNLTQQQDPAGGTTSHSYAGNGDRLSTTDPNSNLTRFTYDSYGNLSSTTDALGGVTSTTWSFRSLPLSMTDPLRGTTTFAYDELGRLTSRTDAMGGVEALTYDPVGNKLTDTDQEGHETTWTYDGENRLLTSASAIQATKSFGYDGNGNKTSETDWNGNQVTFAYDAVNRLQTRTKPLGNVTQFTYDQVGNVLTEQDALGHTTTYQYDDLNRRKQKTDAKNGVTIYGYDGVGNQTSEQDPLGRLTSFTYDSLNRLTQKAEPLGRTTSYQYDSNSNKTQETDPNGGIRQFKYDGLNRLTVQTDALGNATNLSYDAVGNLKVEIDARLSVTKHDYDALNRLITTTDQEGFITQYGYDKVGNRTSEAWPNTNAVTRVYDAVNRLKSTTDSLGAVASFAYDANGNRTQETDGNGNTTTKIYDALNRLTETDLPESRTITDGYDLVGNRTSETDARGNKTQYHYDELNRLDVETDALTNTTKYVYDAVDNKLSETDKRGSTTQFAYDDLNRLQTTTDPLNQAVTVTYDLVGNKISETDKRGIVSNYTYDAENRLLSKVKDGVTLESFQYDEVGNKKFDTDANGNVATYIYDKRNLLLTESRPLAAITNNTYDSIGNLAQERDPENRVSKYTYDLRRHELTDTNGAGETTTYTYDLDSNRTSIQKPGGNIWTYVYDGANRLKNIADPASGTTQYTYDKNNNRLTEVDADGNTTTDGYDELNRNTSRVYADGARATYGYDPNGNRTSLTDPNGLAFIYTFDALNRETNKNYPLPASPTGDDVQTIVTGYDPNGNVLKVTESYSGATGTRVTTKSYDHFDRLIQVTDAFGKTLGYQYDANGNRTLLQDPDSKATSYAFDALNRVSTVTNTSGTTTYAYDRSSLPTQTSYPNSSVESTTYDLAKRVLTVQNTQGASIVSSYQYTYDLNGNRKTQIEVNGGLAETTTYTYDSDDRLQQVAYPDKRTTYTYDPAYNRLTENTVLASGSVDTSRVYAYNLRNQLTGITDNLNAANSVQYAYDANGNQTIKTKNGVTTTFVYDVRDELVTVLQNATTLGMFRYDYQGLRIFKDMGGQVLRYTYDDDSVLLETDNTGATVAKFDYGTRHLLSLTHVTEGREFYLFDGLGSVADLTTLAGGIQARYQYDAFGNFRAQGGSSFNRFSFTGHEQDSETGLYYFKARFYDPDIGRFLSQDSYDGDVDTPPSLHKYLYAYANPAVYEDLEGYESVNTMIDNAAEGCGALSCAGWALLKGVYNVSTLGFAAVHDPVRDAYDQGKISGKQYALKGIGGGLAVAGVGIATAGVGGELVGGATTLAGRVVGAAVVGAATGAVTDAGTQAVHISAGVQSDYDLARTGKAALFGAALGGGSAAAAEGLTAARNALAARSASESAASGTGGTGSESPGSGGSGSASQGSGSAPKVVGESQRASDPAPTAAFETQRPTSQVASIETTPAQAQAPEAAFGADSVGAARVAGSEVEVSRPSLGESEPGAPGASNGETDPLWRVGRHGDMPSPRPEGYESHHGVNSVWMRKNVPGYKPDDAPAVLMKNDPFHNATRAVMNRFRSEIAARQGGSSRNIDWSKVPPGTAWRLAEEQFDAAQAPAWVRIEYFRQFQEYLDSLPKK